MAHLVVVDCGASTWFALMLASPVLGAGWTIVLLIPVVVLWMSVQHELLHGHPTRFNWLNKVLGYAPFALWYPYTLYRDSHLQHHHDHDLTIPGVDPESRYLSQSGWERSSRLFRAVLWLNKTVPGRLLVGPPLALYAMAKEELQRLRQGERKAWLMWLTHGFFTLLMFAFIARYSAVTVWQYVFLVTVRCCLSACSALFTSTAPQPVPNSVRCLMKPAGHGPGCS